MSERRDSTRECATRHRSVCWGVEEVGDEALAGVGVAGE